jgi:hypothetical protein
VRAHAQSDNVYMQETKSLALVHIKSVQRAKYIANQLRRTYIYNIQWNKPQFLEKVNESETKWNYKMKQ